ncbi:hypothetical protein ESCAB7627_2720 [Escherichia albertii TW07627]|uniref:Uncharacterized protein n=1 Tax=Escherichia albertii (strain TW07627) TaxID=502347 RepID=A0ABC9NNI9_ESCAT|nr:hypothetical protein ESCAB7627_2720 [Escherichia albertii TW07627]
MKDFGRIRRSRLPAVFLVQEWGHAQNSALAIYCHFLH